MIVSTSRNAYTNILSFSHGDMIMADERPKGDTPRRDDRAPGSTPQSLAEAKRLEARRRFLLGAAAIPVLVTVNRANASISVSNCISMLGLSIDPQSVPFTFLPFVQSCTFVFSVFCDVGLAESRISHRSRNMHTIFHR